MEGYVKLWRKVIENGWLKNRDLWAFWSYCLCKASHKEHSMMIGHQQVILQPGQFPFGRKKASEELEMSEQTIRTCIDSLRKRKNLTIKSTNKFSIITIINWAAYQGNDFEINQQINQPLTSNQPASNHKQEWKERKNEKNKEYTLEFETFYAAYPRRINKAGAFAAWNKNGRPDLDFLLSAIDKQKKSHDWKKENGKYIPYPATWLNGRRWEDEIIVEKEKDPFSWLDE